MATRIDVARALKSGRRPAARPSARSAATSTRYGTAQADAAAGETVRVLMDGSGEEVEVRVDAPVSKGERVKVVKQGGVYTVVALGTMAKTYATKLEMEQTAEGLEVKISKKVDGPGAIAALSALIRATLSGVEVGMVDEDGNHATPYSVVASDGGFIIMSAGGVPMFFASERRTTKRARNAMPYNATDSASTTEPTLTVVGVESIWSDRAGLTEGTAKLSLGGGKVTDYMFLGLVYTDGKRTYQQVLPQPVYNRATSLSRTVSDGSAIYVASATVAVDESAGTVTLSNNVELYLSPSGTATSAGKLKLVQVLGWA